MQRFSKALALSALTLGVGFSSLAYSQGRVIEETLVVKDPTVAERGNWIAGGAFEYWYVAGKMTQYNNANQKVAEGDLKFTQPGGSGWIGYGDFTLMFTTRSGSGDQDMTYAAGTINAASLKTTSDVKQKDNEFIVRWLARGLSTRFFTPYVVAGYTQTKFDQDETLQPGFFWTINGTPTRQFRYTYKGPVLGLGAIFPINETFGVRVDGRAKFYSAELVSDYGKTTGNGVGGDFITTGYVNFLRNFNIQAGFKLASLRGGDVGYLNRSGLFGMIGYTARF